MGRENRGSGTSRASRPYYSLRRRSGGDVPADGEQHARLARTVVQKSTSRHAHFLLTFPSFVYHHAVDMDAAVDQATVRASTDAERLGDRMVPTEGKAVAMNPISGHCTGRCTRVELLTSR